MSWQGYFIFIVSFLSFFHGCYDIFLQCQGVMMQPCFTASNNIPVGLYMGVATVPGECIRILVEVYS
jgi:hypothetical protein